MSKTIKNVVQPDYAVSTPLTAEFAISPNGAQVVKRGLADELGTEGLNAFYGHVSETYVTKLEWPGAYDIYSEMWRRDPTLRSVIIATKLFAQQAEWKAESPTDKPADREAKDFLDSCLIDTSHTISDFIDDTLSFLAYGWSSFEICYKWRQGPQGENRSLFDDGKIGWRKFASRRQSSFERWEFDDTGGFGGWYQCAAPAYVEQLLPAEYLLHFVAERDGGNPEGIALFESVYEPWHFVKNLQIVNGIGWQRTFVGLPVFEPEEKLSSDDKATIKSVGEGLTVDEKQYVSVPPKVKFHLESTTNTGAASLLDTIKMYRALMLQTFMAEFMMQGLLGVGSYAAQSDKSTLFIMAVNGWLDKIANIWNRFGVVRLFDLEANKINGITELPRVVHTDIRKPNLSELGSFVSQIANYVKWGDDDAIWLRQQAGLPETMPEEEEEEETPPDNQDDNQPVTGEGDQEEDEQPPVDNAPPDNTQAKEYRGVWAELAEFDGRDKERAKLEKELEAKIAKFFEGQAERVTKAAKNDNLNDDFWRGEEEAFNTDLYPVLVDYTQVLAAMAIEDTEAIYSIGADWGLVNTGALDWARQFAADEIRNITTTTREAVRTAVTNWIETGGKLNDLTKALEPTFGLNRARRIAATEITRSYAEGSVRVWQASGMADRPPESMPVINTHIGCRCWVIIQPRAGQWVYVHQTANDERVCFPAGTMIETQSGSRPIDNINIGEKVLTRNGYKKVIATSKTEYTGNLVAIRHERGALVCTEDHPIWVLKKGWLQARYVQIGNCLNTADNQSSNVLNIVKFNIRDTDNIPPLALEIIGLAGISLDVLMPINTVNLQSNAQVYQQEIDTIPTHLGLLYIFNIQHIKSLAYLLFRQCFTLKRPITRKTTKLPISIGWLNSDLFSAVSTSLIIGRAATFLRTIMPGISLFRGPKFLATSLTNRTLNISMAAFDTTNGIAIGNRFEYRKLLTANGADFINLRNSRQLAGVRTIPFSSFNPRWLKIKFLTALGAGSKLAASISFLNTIFKFCGVRWHSKQPQSNIPELYHNWYAKSILVYNLQVEDDPVYYANGVLVHNCPICAPLHNQVIGIARETLAG